MVGAEPMVALRRMRTVQSLSVGTRGLYLTYREGELYRESDDLTEFFDELKKNIKAAQQADFRAQQKST